MTLFNMERLYYASEAILKLAYVNVLAIASSLLGIVVFGIFPAITATFSVVRKWLTGYSDIAITKHFFKVYRREFLKSNLVGWCFTLIGGVLYINLSIAEIINQEMIHLSYYPILAVFILFLCLSLFVIPVYLHYKASVLSVIRHSFIMLFIQPLNTVLMLAGIIFFYLTINTIPGLIPIFGISGFVFIIMYFSLRTFERVSEIQNVKKKDIIT